MPPSRTQVELVVVAALAAALRYVVPVMFQLVAGALLTDPWWYFLGSVLELVPVAVAFGYAYRLGRSGRAGTPRRLTRRLVVAAILGATVIDAASFALQGGVHEIALVAPYVLGGAIRFAILFVLAGLAGVPLGAMAAGDATTADEVGESGPSTRRDAAGDEG